MMSNNQSVFGRKIKITNRHCEHITENGAFKCINSTNLSYYQLIRNSLNINRGENDENTFSVWTVKCKSNGIKHNTITFRHLFFIFLDF